jgi:hypothetical protein
MRARRLALRSETLTELAQSDMAAVVGGITPITESPTACLRCDIPTNGCTERVTKQTCTW